MRRSYRLSIPRSVNSLIEEWHIQVQPYRHAGSDAGILAYETGRDYIRVRFRSGRISRYSHARAGASHVERMKELAKLGRGLTTYISKNVHDLYDRDD